MSTSKKTGSLADFFEDYADMLSTALASVDKNALEAASEILRSAYHERRDVFVCGNGGSAAISNHLHCDHSKGVQTGTHFRPRIISLVSVIETMTAISNDISYDDVFAYQLETMANADDVLIVISSSGKSENIIKALNLANQIGLSTIALTGFDGGNAAQSADVSIHVDAFNYGVVEDVHQSVMHILAQFIRRSAMDPNEIDKTIF